MGGAPRWPGVAASAAWAAATASRIAWAHVGAGCWAAAAEGAAEEEAAAASLARPPSLPPLLPPLFLFHLRHARVAQSRQRVLPVPVGDSSRALVPCFEFLSF